MKITKTETATILHALALAADTYDAHAEALELADPGVAKQLRRQSTDARTLIARLELADAVKGIGLLAADADAIGELEGRIDSIRAKTFSSFDRNGDPVVMSVPSREDIADAALDAAGSR